MKILTSRKGFTLIELLVVIGILAVLAAIAIPSVAGLIDRANVSADKTNANEMTNAMERFASEYELFCQDITSGTFDKDNMDAAQGRVYNVLGIENRAGIELVEIDADEPVDDDDIAIYRDTKYPANAKTAQLIVQNYTKTSSSTFEPKQSDMHYWYSPDCGVIVYAEPNADQDKENKLNSQIISGMDAKGNKLDESTEWIDLTNNIRDTVLTEQHKDIIPTGGVYYVGVTSTNIGDYSDATATYTAGQPFPSTVSKNDVYVYGDYEYRYQKAYTSTQWERDYSHNWGVVVLDNTKSSYGNMLSSICNKPVNNLSWTFGRCKSLKTAPKISDNAVNMLCTFAHCDVLTSAPTKIPDGVTNLTSTFYKCISLRNINFTIPSKVYYTTTMFSYCTSLTNAPAIPSNVENMRYMFSGCTSLSGNIVIDTNTEEYKGFVGEVNISEQNISFSGTSTKLDLIGATGLNYCSTCDGACKNNH